MPRKSKKDLKKMTRKEAFKTATFGGYLNVELNEEYRKNFEVWSKENSKKAIILIGDLLEVGIDLKIYMDWINDTVIVQMLMITQPDFKIWTISSYAGDVEKAVLIALFKHFILLDNDWHKEINDIGEKPFYG